MKRARLVAARIAHGWSQEAVANQIDVTRVTYSSWERGLVTPYPVHTHKLCVLFEKTPEELDLVEKTQESASNVAQQLQNSPMVPIHISLAGFDMLIKSRRQVLQDSLNLACAAITLSPYDLLPKESRTRITLAQTRPSYLNDDILDDFSAITAHYRNISRNSSVGILSGLSGHFSNIAQFLNDSHPAPIHERLCSLASENALLLGEIFHEIKEYDLAWSHYKFSLKTAMDTGNIDLWATGVGRVALLQFYWGEPQDGLLWLQETRKRQPQNQRIRAWLSAIEAEIYAGLGKKDACLRFLEKSRSVTLPATLDDDRYSTNFNTSRAAGYEGACFLLLREPDLALSALEQSLASCNPTALVRQSRLRADKGIVYAQLGNPKEACHLLRQSLDVTMKTKSLVVMQRVYKARNELDPWKQSAEVKDLDAQIRDTFTTLTKLKEEVKG
jgi:DNA-binding XRE family transcriptional regulator/tetratricopeptide (TPR) repeat protein